MLRSGARTHSSRCGFALSSLPGIRIEAQQPTLSWPKPIIAATPPNGGRWLHEIHRSGMLVRASVSANQEVVLTTRDSTLPALFEIEAALRSLAGGEALFEGYLVAHARHGAFEEALRDARHLVFYAHDLLYFRGGYNLTGVALHWRKRALRNLFLQCPRLSGQVTFGDHVRGDGSSFWRRACEMGFDGIVSKSREGPYDPLRYHWIWSPPSTVERQPDSLIRCA